MATRYLHVFKVGRAGKKNTHTIEPVEVESPNPQPTTQDRDAACGLYRQEHDLDTNVQLTLPHHTGTTSFQVEDHERRDSSRGRPNPARKDRPDRGFRGNPDDLGAVLAEVLGFARDDDLLPTFSEGLMGAATVGLAIESRFGRPMIKRLIDLGLTGERFWEFFKAHCNREIDQLMVMLDEGTIDQLAADFRG